ncbi:Uncharacterized protein FKW44_018528 [Caligus rogercresseyi]|uniref:Uncharacterized protein n=1 Tax=Caligus rogercresseyi TaxID=217165 RepID=A0A7T8GUJ2_CALRO|nr:Uncharacterized protein FKW44_018528 [Caligus rogercresseyi]
MLYRKLVHISGTETSRTVVKWSKICLVPDAHRRLRPKDNVDKIKEGCLKTVVPA